MNDSKINHIEFVTGHNGTNYYDIFVTLLLVPFIIANSNLILSYFNDKNHYLIEFISLVVPLVLIITSLYHIRIIILLFNIIFFLFSKIILKYGIYHENKETNFKKSISLFKGATMFMTCIAIIAVDFQLFSRDQAKTETYGISFMDVGTGIMIFSSGISSYYSRRIENKNSIIKYLYNRFLVLILGIGRLLLLKAFSYPEHVSEYGTEWNFFVTIFCVWILSDILKMMLSFQYILYFNILILFIYQFLLSNNGLTEYIFNSPRINFISSNREGFFSLFGLFPLYTFSEYLSHNYLFCVSDSHCVENTPKQSLRKLDDRIFNLFAISIIFYILYFISNNFIQTISRRLANFAYIFAVISLSFACLFTFSFIEYLIGKEINLKFIEIVNLHQLYVFILANLLTGLINVSIDTLLCSNIFSLFILFIYCILLYISTYSLSFYLKSK